MRRVLINGAAGVVAFLHGQHFSIAAVTIKNGKIVEIDFLTDPDRIAQLDLTDGARQVVSQPRRLSISLASERLSRRQASWTAPSASVAIRAFGRTPPAVASDAPRSARRSSRAVPQSHSSLGFGHSTDHPTRPL